MASLSSRTLLSATKLAFCQTAANFQWQCILLSLVTGISIAMSRESDIWAHLFDTEFNVNSILPEVREFVIENYAIPSLRRKEQIIEFKESIKHRVRQFKRIAATPKKNRVARDAYTRTLDQFMSSLQMLDLEDSESDECADQEAPVKLKSASQTPDLNELDKKREALKASFKPVAQTSRRPTRVRVELAPPPRSPMMTRSKAARMHAMDKKMKNANHSREERLRMDVERKKREREDRERRVMQNLRKRKHMEEDKTAAIREKDLLPELQRKEQLNSLKRTLKQSPSRSRVQPFLVDTPRFGRPTFASSAKEELARRKAQDEEEAHIAQALKQVEVDRKRAAAEEERSHKERIARENAEEKRRAAMVKKAQEERERAAEKERQRLKMEKADNYSLGDLQDGASTDDEANPRNRVPSWAEKSNYMEAARRQEQNEPNIVAGKLFPPLVQPDLKSIFANHRRGKNFDKRTSSAQWPSPLCQPSAAKSRMPPPKPENQNQSFHNLRENWEMRTNHNLK